jgi:transcriptional regulator with XRE-family HTH domain
VPAETPEQLIERVARRIVELRHDANRTQEDLAEALETSVQYVSRIEVGENLTLATIAKIARALDVTVDELLQPPEPTPRRTSRGRPRKSVRKRSSEPR